MCVCRTRKPCGLQSLPCCWYLVSRQSYRDSQTLGIPETGSGWEVRVPRGSSSVFPKHKWFSLKESVVCRDSKRIPSSAASVATLSGELQQKPQAGTVNTSSAYVKRPPSANSPCRCAPKIFGLFPHHPVVFLPFLEHGFRWRSLCFPVTAEGGWGWGSKGLSRALLREVSGKGPFSTYKSRVLVSA